MTLKRATNKGAPAPVEAFKQKGADFIVRDNLGDLVAAMAMPGHRLWPICRPPNFSSKFGNPGGPFASNHQPVDVTVEFACPRHPPRKSFQSDRMTPS